MTPHQIHRPVDDPLLSERDRSNPTLAELRDDLPDW